MRKLLLVLVFAYFQNSSFSQGVLHVDSVNHNPTWCGDNLVLYLAAFGPQWGSDSGVVNVEINGNIVLSKPITSIPVGNQQWIISIPNISPSFTLNVKSLSAFTVCFENFVVYSFLRCCVSITDIYFLHSPACCPYKAATAGRGRANAHALRRSHRR